MVSQSIVASLVLLAAGLLITSGHAQSQEADAAFKRLAGAKTLRCIVGRGASIDWESGTPRVELGTWQKGNTFHYDSIDVKRGQARLIGNAGASDVMAHLTIEGLHFFEQTPSGNMTLSTVFAAKAAGKFLFVTSRHINLSGTPLTSQYSGTCERLE